MDARNDVMAVGMTWVCCGNDVMGAGMTTGLGVT